MITLEHYKDHTVVFAKGHSFKTNKQFAYVLGYVPPRYPLPATLASADIALIWTTLNCPLPNGPCNACIQNYIDQLS